MFSGENERGRVGEGRERGGEGKERRTEERKESERINRQHAFETINIKANYMQTQKMK